MTPDEFREFALSLPEAVEASHMNHPDFRVGGKIFATLCKDGTWGMVKLPRDDQAGYIAGAPGVFTAANGAWGRAGATIVQLADADAQVVREALLAAWRKTAPKKLLDG